MDWNKTRNIVIYENKKIVYFLPNKDKIPKLSKSEVIYQITCPGCSNSYIGKTERCLKSRLSERSDPTKSAVGHHFCNCENVRHIVGMHHLLTTLTTKQLTQTMFLSLFLILSSIILELFTLPILEHLTFLYFLKLFILNINRLPWIEVLNPAKNLCFFFNALSWPSFFASQHPHTYT